MDRSNTARLMERRPALGALLIACLGLSLLTAACKPSAPVKVAPAATLSYVETGDLRARPQLLSGWYGIENGSWRWMARQAEATLVVPNKPELAFELRLFFPPEHMQKAGGPITVAVLFDGQPFAEETYPSPGGYTLKKTVPPGLFQASSVKLTIRLDRAVPAGAADHRELGAVVNGFGFR